MQIVKPQKFKHKTKPIRMNLYANDSIPGAIDTTIVNTETGEIHDYTSLESGVNWTKLFEQFDRI